MSVFSDLLEEILTEKDIRISQLAKATGISRATLHHYVYGQRPIQKKEHFDAIVGALTLSPGQMESMREAYQIELIGEPLYRQRRQIFQFFRSLGTIQEKSMTDEFHIAELPDDNSEVTGSEVIAERNKVSLAIFNILEAASERGDTVMLYADPLSPGLMPVLNSPSLSTNASDFSHIFKLESASNRRDNRNIETIEAVIKYATVIQKYRPLFYYESHTDGEMMFQLTDFIVSSREVLLFSRNGDYAIYDTNKECIALFQDMFLKMSEKCRMLGHNFDFNFNSMGDLSDFMSVLSHGRMNSDEKSLIAVSGTACITYVWTEDTIRRYLRRDLPDYETFANALTAYSKSMREIFCMQKWTVLMRIDYLERFFETGGLGIYKDAFVSDRINVEDRKNAALDMIRLIEQGKVDIALAHPHRFPVTELWEGFFSREGMRLFNYNDCKCTVVTLNEPSFSGAVCDYFVDYAGSEYVIKGKDAADMIRKWVDEYLS